MRYLLTALTLSFSLYLPASVTPPPGPHVERVESIYALTNAAGNSGGTAFLVRTPSGHEVLLTNAHVCQVGYVVEIGRKRIPTQVIEVSNFTDLCVLAVPAEIAATDKPLELANTKPRLFEPVYVIGQGLLLGNTLTRGHFISQLTSPILAVMFPYYITATVLPGNSGSPAFNEQGKVFGVVYASSASLANRGLLVPIEDIKEFLLKY